MAITTRNVTTRRTQAQNALRRADANRDGKLSQKEQAKARSLVSGATRAAVDAAMAQGRVRGGVSVAKASERLTTAGRTAAAVDRNRDGVISAAERSRLSGPIARALTQGATGTTAPATNAGSTTVSGSRRPGSLVVPAELRRYGNGRIPANKLKSVGIGSHKLYGPAADNFVRMRAAAKAAGINLTITDSYRSYAAQVDLARRKGLYSQGGLAATPGRSNHGWGLAIDANVNSAATLRWMRNNAHKFGFYETVRREPWHWEFRPR
ncbi:MAG: D-alanyl-D-alanine carboxypeptidase family protein [Myxococcota bacterium]